MDLILSALPFLKPIFEFLAKEYGTVGIIIAYLLIVVGPSVTLLIELMELIVSITVSKKDDAFAAKVKLYWSKILPIFEILPHANVPIAAGAKKLVEYLGKAVLAIRSAIESLKSQA